MPIYTAKFSHDDTITRTTRATYRYTHAWRVYSTDGNPVAEGFTTSENSAHTKASAFARRFNKPGLSTCKFEVTDSVLVFRI
jgi:hypothetical protein